MAAEKLHSFWVMKASPARSSAVRLSRARRRLALLLGTWGLVLLMLGPAWAGDGALDPFFNPGVGANAAAMLWGQFLYSDGSGKVMITGSFREMGGAARTDVARVFADGSIDPSFNAPIDNASNNINTCFLLNPGSADSQMIILGDFSVPSTSGTYYGVARLNSDGSVDPTFGHAFTSGDGVQAFGRQSTGKLVVGGYGMQVNGYPGQAFYLLRLNADGTVDTGFTMRSGVGGMIVGAGIESDQIRLFGDIPRFTDSSHLDHMLLLSSDGNTVVASLGDEYVNGTILGMVTQGSNTIIFGPFTKVYGSTMNGIARLLPGGGLDSTFKIGDGANGHVKRVTIVSSPTGPKLVLCGYFNFFNQTPCGYLVRLNNDGSVDTNFNAGTGADDRIWNMNLQGDGTWILLGAFQSYNGSPRQCLAHLAADGSLDTTRFASFTTSVSGLSPKVYAIQDSPQGLYIAGAISGYGGKLHRRVARANFDGTPDQTFRAGMGGTVYSITTQEDRKLLVAGHFGVGTGYVGCTSLARLNLDGTVDLDFKPLLAKADGTLPDLYMVDVQDNGQILVGGNFAQVGDASRTMHPRSAFARLNPDGSLDETFNAQITIPGGTDIQVYAGGEVDGLYHVAGHVMIGGQERGFYTRLTGTGALDTTFGPSGGQIPAPHVNLFNGAVRSGTNQGERIIVSGDFTQIIDNSPSPPQVGHLARFDTSGLWDNTFAAGAGTDGPIYGMDHQRDGKVLIGGAFTSYNGVGRNNLARLKSDGSLDPVFDPGTGPNNTVFAIAMNNYSGVARIGGAFKTYAGVSRIRIAQIVSHNISFNPALLLLLEE